MVEMGNKVKILAARYKPLSGTVPAVELLRIDENFNYWYCTGPDAAYYTSTQASRFMADPKTILTLVGKTHLQKKYGIKPAGNVTVNIPAAKVNVGYRGKRRQLFT